MANGRNRDFMMVSLAVSSVPLAFVLYFIAVDQRWSAIIAFVVFLIVLILCTCAFLSWKTIKLTIPLLLSVLRGCAYVLSPMASMVRGIPLVGKAVNGVIKLTFWVWFVILMMSDVLVRKFLKGFVGLHEPSAGQYSAVNSCDTNFQPCGEFGKVLDQHKVQRIEDGGQDFERDHDEKAIALMNQKSKDLAVLRENRQLQQQQQQEEDDNDGRRPLPHPRRAGLTTLKPRPKSMDYSKYRTPGQAGSDLSSMTNEEWMTLLQSANIDSSRFADPGARAGANASARAAAAGYRPSLESRHKRHSSVSSNGSSTFGSIVHEYDAMSTGSTTSTNTTTTTTKPPRYSQPIATTLAMVSKLVYEDVPIIRHELELSGYDLNTFRAIAYKNTCGFIVQKGRNIILVFRGTDPLNLQNAWTDLQARLVAIQTKDETPIPLGKCHQGMYQALGTDDFLLPSEELGLSSSTAVAAAAAATAGMSQLGGQDERALQHYDDHHHHHDPSSPQRTSLSPVNSFRSEVSRTSGTIHLELSNHSIYHTISTSIRAAYTLILFLLRGLFTHVTDPVDHRFAGEVRDLGAFGQASRWVDGLRLEHEEKVYQQQAMRQIHPPPLPRKNSTGGSYRRESLSKLSDVYTVADHRWDALDMDDSNGHVQNNVDRYRGTSTKHHHRRRSSSMGEVQPNGSRNSHGGGGSGSHERGATPNIGGWRGIEGALQEYQRRSQDGLYGGTKKKKQKKLRFFVAGHSLGGGLATLFVAKLVQTKSPLLNIFSGLYTYGNPKIGDKDFSRAFGYSLASKMFHHVHNNDIISRVPFWGTYATVPGTLVFLDTSRKLSLYPPDRDTLMPVPVRPISFLHLSGIFNIRVIMRMRRESWLRILERFLLPFFMNDHFPCDYVKALAEAHQVEVVLEDNARFGGVDENETTLMGGSGIRNSPYLPSGLEGRTRSGLFASSPSTAVPIGGSRPSAAAAAAAAVTASGSSTNHISGRGLGIRRLEQDLDSDSGIGGDLPEGGRRARDLEPQHRRQRRIVKYALPSSSLKYGSSNSGSGSGSGNSDRMDLEGDGSFHSWRRLAGEQDVDDDEDEEEDDDDEEVEGEEGGRPHRRHHRHRGLHPAFDGMSSSARRGRYYGGGGGGSNVRRRSRSSSRSRSTGHLQHLTGGDGLVTLVTTTMTTTTMTSSSSSSSALANGGGSQFYVTSPGARRRSQSRRRSTISSTGGMTYY
ncbi:hypothetical protein DFQ27_009667 [Actinomortierella ambigua]|uniref:Fungal lipase-type domain-containing protein n=1 Tax=Actinomortierella ambigua TaxID=1343610 RepID=A0A9P6U9L1_9FUNG|nr:hypothetical protein DFQ27_009667 [Actinomortierella ambigua]